jgi:hypothetical protein
MNHSQHIRRLAAALAGLASALLAFAAAAPAALASGHPPPLPPIREKHPSLHAFLPPFRVPVRVPVHTVVIGGMPGWQIALIAVGAALLAATVAVLLDRARAAHQKTITAAA